MHGGVRGRGSNPPTYSIIQSFINKKKLHPYSEWSFVFNVVSEGLVIANDHSVAFTMDIDDGNFLVFAQ